MSEEKFDPLDYKSAKKCLKSIFNSIQKVPKKDKKPPKKKKTKEAREKEVQSSILDNKSSSKKISKKVLDTLNNSSICDDVKIPMKSFYRQHTQQ